MLSLTDILKSVIMGAIEGLTEFIPVSSTAHLLLASWVINFNSIGNYLFEIVVQSGAILAVCVLYRKRIFSIIKNPYNKNNFGLIIKLLVSFLPAAFAGILLHDFIKDVLFSPLVIAFALIIGGIIIILVDYRYRKPQIEIMDDISYFKSFLIGICQSLAIIPGVSRSGATIIGGVLLKVSRKAITEFSFFMSIIVISSATIFDIFKNYHNINFSNFNEIIIGFISAFISALIVVKWFIKYVSNHNFIIFAIYRIILGCAILIFFIF
jgi:undecaprenyl-diphosphatase